MKSIINDNNNLPSDEIMIPESVNIKKNTLYVLYV